MYTTVKKLYKGEFKYSIVLRLYHGDIFQGKDKARYTKRYSTILSSDRTSYRKEIQAEVLILPQLYEYIIAMDHFATRYESPRLHIYTNTYSDIEHLRDMLADNLIISIGIPPDGLEPGMVYMPDTHYEFRVTLGSITKVNQEFVEWAEGNKNVKLQHRTKRTLTSPGIYNSGTQLYVNGERNLLFVRLHLGNVNLTVDRILKDKYINNSGI